MSALRLCLILAAMAIAMLPLSAANQTSTLTAITLTNNLPYTLGMSVYDMGTSAPPAIQGYVKANSGNDWLIIAGRTNGLHSFTGGGLVSFPPDEENTMVYVVNPVTQQVWSRSLNDANSGLTAGQVDGLSVTAPEFAQVGTSLYMVGGYGYDNTNQIFKTFQTLTSINIPAAIAWTKGGSGTLASAIEQTSDPSLQVTGGSLQFLNGHANLVFGQNYTGGYDPQNNGAYTQQVRTFDITDTGTSLTLSNQTASTPSTDYRRRDLNVAPILTAGGTVPGAVAFAGVFTTTNGVWTVPVEVGADGSTTEADPAATSTFKQGMNSYITAQINLYSASRDQSHTILIGGIGIYYYSTTAGRFVLDTEVPFNNSISSIVRSSNGTYQPYYLGEIPTIPNPANNNAPFLFGADADVLMSQDLAYTSNGMVDMDTLSASTPTVLGYMYGGIAAVQHNGGSSGASDVMFAVTYQPAATLDLAGLNATTGSLTGSNPTTITNTGASAGVLSVGKGLTSADSFTYSGLIKNGTSAVGLNLLAGSLTLTNANTYTGGTTISGGALIAGNGSALGTGNVNLQSGVLSNGNQALNIGGTFTQTGGTLELTAINPVQGGIYNVVNVSGNATLGGTLKVNARGFQPGQTFTITLTANAITGNFTQVVSAQPGIVIGTESVNGNKMSVTVSVPSVNLGDGVPNLLKLVTDIDPTQPMTTDDRAALPALGTDTSGDLTLTFRKYSLLSGVTVAVQTSTDLQTWATLTQSSALSSTTYTMQANGSPDANGDQSMQVAVQPSGGPRQFIRLHLTQP